MRRLSFSLMVMLIAIPAFAGFGDSCDQTAVRYANVGAAGVKLVTVTARAGSLQIVGKNGLSEVRAHGTACASRKGLLDDVRLTARRSGDRIDVVVDIPQSMSWGSQARLDLVVEVPMSIAMDVKDGSGSASISGVGSLTIEDGSGELSVKNVAGSLEIEDGSGDVEISDVSGDIDLVDGSGGVDILRVSGNVTIGEDGSGGIEIRDVKKSVMIRDDGSGSIDVADVSGDFTVGSDGSGGVSFQRVGGRVKIPRD